MKTSNKLLLGAFVIILIGMIFSNIYLKSEIKNIKKNAVNKELIQDKDTVIVDSSQYNVHIHVR